MNEIQIHAMLAEAVAKKGGEVDADLQAELEMDSKRPVEMTDK